MGRPAQRRTYPTLEEAMEAVRRLHLCIYAVASDWKTVKVPMRLEARECAKIGLDLLIRADMAP